MNYNGPATLTITTNDLGNFGIGSVQSDTDSVAITVTAVNGLQFNVQPTDAQAGSAFTVTVEARDGAGNVDTGFTGSVTISAAATGGSNFTAGNITVNALAGVATFPGLVLNDAANNFIITASTTTPEVDSGTSNAFDVTAPTSPS